MTLDEMKRRFVDEVKLRGYDDKYIDRKEEREILQIAIQNGISIDSARSSLLQVCEGQNFVLESAVLAKLKDILETSAGNDGKVDEKEYKDAVLNLKKWTNGNKNDIQVRKMVIEVIQECSFKTSAGWFSDWFAREKKELGM